MTFIENLGRAALGMAVLIGACYLLCKKKKQINWQTIMLALAMQIVFAVLVLKVPFVNIAFEWIAWVFVKILQYARYGPW